MPQLICLTGGGLPLEVCRGITAPMLPMTQKININVQVYPTLCQFYEAVGHHQNIQGGGELLDLSHKRNRCLRLARPT